MTHEPSTSYDLEDEGEDITNLVLKKEKIIPVAIGDGTITQKRLTFEHYEKNGDTNVTYHIEGNPPNKMLACICRRTITQN